MTSPKVFGNDAGALPDDALMRGVVAGEVTALSGLYTRYAAPTFALLSRMLGSAAEAEEQLQEVFFALWREGARFDPARGSLKVWLYTLARRRALDQIRARQSRPHLGADEDARLSAAGAASGASPEEASFADERARAVSRALAKLPPKQAEALRLAFFSGLSQLEISARLRVPLGTIKSRVRDGIARLRAPLQVYRVC
jgi:RNA polymerase sigma-70 factor, ECF subfamily